MSDKIYMDSKFKHFDSWKEAIYADEIAVLVWCDNYRQVKKLMNQLYHAICNGRRDRYNIIHHANMVKFNYINKRFVFATDPLKFAGYSRYKAIYMDMRGKDAF